MKHLFAKPFFVGAAMVIALVGLTSVSPAIADRDAWTWTDKSSALPRRDVAITLSAERQGATLLSDGSNLWRFDGAKVEDLTQEARNRGLNNVKLLASDGRQWLMWSRGADDVRGQLWLRDNETWTDITRALPSTVETLEAVGHDGQWYLRSTARGTTRLVFLNGITSIPQDVTLPIEASQLPTGCRADGLSTICTGLNRAVNVNGQWFWLGGASEARTNTGSITQTASVKMWRISGNDFIPMTNAPSAKFVSRVWSTANGALVATSESISNPQLADRLWSFDGTRWTDLTTQARAHGLLPVDANKVQAAFGGNSWMVISGSKLFRVEGVVLNAKGETKDRYATLVGGNGFVLTAPERLTVVSDDIGTPEVVTAAPNITVQNAAALSNAISGTDLRIDGIPADLKIGDGKAFTFRASAEDLSGIERVEIYVNGARIRICQENSCTFTQTYWTNGQAARTVTFQAKAWNRLGASVTSRIITLNIQRDSVAGLAPQTIMNEPARTLDRGSAMYYASWIVPPGAELPAGSQASYITVGQDKIDGISSIEIWANGKNVKTCAGASSKAEVRCEAQLIATDYPTGTDIFLNARITDVKGNALWIPATTLKRPAPPVIAANTSTVKPTVTTPVAPVVSAPVFASRLVIEPNTTDIRRGSTITVRALSQDNKVGMERVEISYGGQIRQICRYGIAMSEVKCDLTLDTAAFADNTSFSFVARAINTEGKETWSNGQTVTIRSATWSPTPAGATASTEGLTQWSWLTPPVSEIEATQETTYQVGTWSPDGIAKIEMFVNGAVRKTCGFVSGTMARDCTYTIRTSDWNHGQVVTVNARITDNAGRIAWSDVKNILISRAWWEPMNRPGAYVTLNANKTDSYVSGEKLSFTMTGWSPNGAERLELWMDGKMVAACPSDICTWTSQGLTAARVEFQARLVDRQGKETWTGLYGLNKK